LYGCLCGALQSCPVGEIYVVIKKQFFGGDKSTERMISI
jgi:hypothetical protein